MRKSIWCLAAMLPLAFASVACAATGTVILNEWNCVGETKYLGGSSSTGSGFDPAFLPKHKGNGGNWVELVVCQDHADLRGMTLYWDNADPSSGTVTFKNVSEWSDVRSGVIITVMEAAIDEGEDIDQYGWEEGSDLTVDYEDDWHMHVLVSDDDLVTHSGPFKVDNDDWGMKIMNGATLYQDWIGEAETGWAGGGIASTEIGKLEDDPSTSVVIGDYDDGDNSTFGAPNTWNGGLDSQDFSALRSW